MADIQIPDHIWNLFEKFVADKEFQDTNTPYNRLELGGPLDSDGNLSVRYELIIDMNQPRLKQPVVSAKNKTGHAYFDFDSREANYRCKR